MSRPVIVESRFKRRFRHKTEQMRAAIEECVRQLAENERHPGLRVHRVSGARDVWEAYIDGSNRITFHYDSVGRIVLRNHCNHDITKQSP